MRRPEKTAPSIRLGIVRPNAPACELAVWVVAARAVDKLFFTLRPLELGRLQHGVIKQVPQAFHGSRIVETQAVFFEHPQLFVVRLELADAAPYQLGKQSQTADL